MLFFLLMGILPMVLGSEDAVGMTRALQVLIKDGYNPSWIIDGGANVGKWSQGIQKVFPDSSILMLDANDRHKEVLTGVRDQFRQAHPSSHYDFKIGLLGDEDGRNVTFYTRTEKLFTTGDSMFIENTKAYSNTLHNKYKEVVQPMRTVDTLFRDFRRAAGDPASMGSDSVGLLKLDIQGGEMGALVGAAEVLKQTPVVVCELSVSQMNSGAPLMFETLVVLRRFGFILYDITDIVRWGRGAIQVDAIFVHKDATYWDKEKTGLPRPETPPASLELRHIYQQSLHELWRESKADTVAKISAGKVKQAGTNKKARRSRR